MKTFSPVPVVLGLLAVVQSAAAGDPGTTQGIIDIGKPERPADAVTLVGPDGYHLIPEGKAPTQWVFADGILTASPAWDSVVTRESYQDFRMHVEFNVNQVKDVKDPEADGNSGIYIQNRYEIQIHNSYGVPEADYKASYCGSIYRRKKPDRLVCKPAGEWQSFDIVFRAARFDGQKKTANARITVFQNGALIHDDYSIPGKTGAGEKEGPEPRPIKLQGHHNPVRFRNVWIQKLPHDAEEAIPAAKVNASAHAADRKPNFLIIYTDDHRWDAMGGVPTLYAVRTTTHKLVKYPNRPEWTEVFDLAADPYEIENLASDAAWSAKLEAELTTVIKAANYTVPPSANRAPLDVKVDKLNMNTKRRPWLNAVIVLTSVAGLVSIAAEKNDQAPTHFYAYYTKLDYQQPQDPALLGQIPVNAARVFAGDQADRADQSPRPPKPGQIRWGKYADLIVNIAEGRRLVFSRATGYLPYYQAAKGRFPFKPLADCRPDPLCLCSYVRVVEDRPERIVVHWRHVPDPASVVMTEVVHEMFTITPDAKVRREVRVGTPKIEEFNDPANVMVQELTLTESGFTELSLTKAAPSNEPIPAVAGAPVRPAPARRPATWFQFDDGLVANRGEARELVSGTICSIAGNKALWKKGVSGTALAFDGYFSKIELPKAKAPALTDELTVEAWVALGAYPWNDAGIVHCSAGSPIGPEDYKHGYRDPYVYHPWKMEGYMLGVDPYGRPIFKLNGRQVGGGVLEPKDTVPARDVLPTYRWTHLAGTYGRGRMCLYVDGKLVASEPASGPVVLPDRDVLIGLNGDAQRVSDPVSHSERAANNNLPLVYGIEGLIDEVRIHAQSLSADEIRVSFEALCPPPAAVTGPDLERRILPGTVTGQPAAKFGASCETLKFHELWDNLWRPDPYRDIVVCFDSVPGRVVFWQGINSGSGWVTENNKWMADQSWEIGGPHGCAEHMADKRGRFNHVRLIENTDARVVIHWRYASIDVGYVFGETGVWADEYYTIYPDGVGVRYVEGIDGGWHDTQFLSEPGTTCLDNIDLMALTVANTKGRSADLTWRLPNHVPPNPIEDACIKQINFKSHWKIFAIYQEEGAGIGQWGEGEQSKHTPDPFAGPWNHWPVGLNPSDGRYAVSTDRVTHAALGGADRTGSTILHGFTDQPAASLVTLAKSWNRPPAITNTAGCESKGYDPSQRAYVLGATGVAPSCRIAASAERPIVNPCFVVRNWNTAAPATLDLNSEVRASGPKFRQGIVRDPNGRPSLVVWLQLEATEPTTFTLRGARPETSASIPIKTEPQRQP